MELQGLRLAPNWTTAAGALEGILDYLGAPLARHAVMGLTGHAWHLSVVERDGVTALPEGAVDLDFAAMVDRYALTGYRWERFAGARDDAVDWATAHLDAGRPLIGWDFHLHEFAVVYGYDRAREGFLVEAVLTPEVGPLALWRDWPSSLGLIELFAPTEPTGPDPLEAIGAALHTAVTFLEGSARGNPGLAADRATRGAPGFDAWADALEGDLQIDRAGNAYILQLVQTARRDGAAFLADIAASIPDLAPPLLEAERAERELAKALAPLVTLFPFPTGGHGNVANPGLRQAAANPLRRAARFDREATAAIRSALTLLEE